MLCDLYRQQEHTFCKHCCCYAEDCTYDSKSLHSTSLAYLEIVEEREQKKTCEYWDATESYDAFQHSIIHNFRNLFLVFIIAGYLLGL